MEESEAPEVNNDFFDEFFNALKEILADKDEESCYKEMYRMLDTERKGFISNEDFRVLFGTMKTQLQLSDQEVEELMDDIDKNKDGKVDFLEFYKFMLKE